MAQENREIVAAVLATGIIAHGKYPVQAVAPRDADMAVDLYQHCLKELDRQAELIG